MDWYHKTRVQEMKDEIQKLREANRRLQASGPELERDKLIRQLRELLVEKESILDVWIGNVYLQEAITALNFAAAHKDVEQPVQSGATMVAHWLSSVLALTQHPDNSMILKVYKDE